MVLSQDGLDYFNLGHIENPRYWERLGGKPNFKNTKVIDLGCGHGSLCIDIAESGAMRVLGLDLNPQLIDFAKENLKRNYPQFVDTIEFRCEDLRKAPESEIDYFVSKDTFEHVIELGEVLAEMKKRLSIGGRVYTGFNPLWNSPFGDHGRTKILLPWGHILFSERFLINWRNRFVSPKVASIHDLGLNALSYAEYIRIFHSCGMAILYLQVNVSKNPVIRLFSVIRQIPFLEEYFTKTLYCILEKQIE